MVSLLKSKTYEIEGAIAREVTGTGPVLAATNTPGLGLRLTLAVVYLDLFVPSPFEGGPVRTIIVLYTGAPTAPYAD